MADEPSTTTGATPPSEHGVFPPFDKETFFSQLFWLVICFAALYIMVSKLILPLGLTVALTALELLVAFLQAYVFAILTCIYLNDAIHPGH